jgi:hypothetical protein
MLTILRLISMAEAKGINFTIITIITIISKGINQGNNLLMQTGEITNLII